jgi:hypothetical protein
MKGPGCRKGQRRGPPSEGAIENHPRETQGTRHKRRSRTGSRRPLPRSVAHYVSLSREALRIATPTGSQTTKSSPRVTGWQPSDQGIDDAIDSASRLVPLATMRDRYGEIADAPPRERLSHWAFLAELLPAACDERDARRAARRVHKQASQESTPWTAELAHAELNDLPVAPNQTVTPGVMSAGHDHIDRSVYCVGCWPREEPVLLLRRALAAVVPVVGGDAPLGGHRADVGGGDTHGRRARVRRGSGYPQDRRSAVPAP